VLLLLDGPDLTGKTDLARRLHEDLGFEVVVRRGPPEVSSWDDYGAPPELGGYAPGCGRHIVCDRWHFSEAVWPVFFERETDMDGSLFRAIEDRLLGLGAVAVYARRSQRALELALEGSGEPVEPERVGEVLRLYDEVMTRSALPVVEYNFDESDSYHPLVFAAARAEERRTT